MKKNISEVLFEEMPGYKGNLGIITLNRPSVLNALNHVMFTAIDEQLIEWGTQTNIKAIVVRAVEGRAFCAGGDIRHAYESKKKNDPHLIHFFADEYRMNSRIYHFPKPYISLLDGITMGGGVGISIHGSHRVGTDRLIFSLPETGIGFYPDVGTTYYLSRLPYKIGFYLGLTGARISYSDCFAIGIVQDIVSRESLSSIIAVLADTHLADNRIVSDCLKSFGLPVPPSELFQHKEEIEYCFSKPSVETILEALDSYSTEWCKQTAETIKTKSPTSLKVTLHALHEASKLNFDACMQMEYQLTEHFVQGHDFFEGIRAVIIDKDQKPKWQPAMLSDVSSQEVEKYFMPSALTN